MQELLALYSMWQCAWRNHIGKKKQVVDWIQKREVRHDQTWVIWTFKSIKLGVCVRITFTHGFLNLISSGFPHLSKSSFLPLSLLQSQFNSLTRISLNTFLWLSKFTSKFTSTYRVTYRALYSDFLRSWDFMQLTQNASEHYDLLLPSFACFSSKNKKQIYPHGSITCSDSDSENIKRDISTFLGNIPVQCEMKRFPLMSFNMNLKPGDG